MNGSIIGTPFDQTTVRQRMPKVLMLGLRGFPNVQGGVESHAQNVCPLLAEFGCEMHVLARAPYLAKDTPPCWNGVHIHRLWAPRGRHLEAFVHTLLGVLYAALMRPDIVHIHGIGPALLTPLARLLGLKVVVTHHGTDYDRQKWSPVAKLVLRLGEFLGMRFANKRIAVSKAITELIRRKYHVEAFFIPNGVAPPTPATTTDSLKRFTLEPGRYILFVGRFVPEKRQLDLIAAFREAALLDWKLVMVGALDETDDYHTKLIHEIAHDDRLVATGFCFGPQLSELYTYAGLFVLPSSHEGLPIALLEALSYGIPVLASNIPAHLELQLPPRSYFPLGDIKMLAHQLREQALTPLDQRAKDDLTRSVLAVYDWRTVAKQTLSVYLGR